MILGGYVDFDIIRSIDNYIRIDLTFSIMFTVNNGSVDSFHYYR